MTASTRFSQRMPMGHRSPGDSVSRIPLVCGWDFPRETVLVEEVAFSMCWDRRGAVASQRSAGVASRACSG